MPEPKAAPETKIGLVTKLATIMGELGNVKKEGFNTNQKYKFVRESDLVEKLSPLLAKYHVFLHQTVLSHSLVEMYKTSSGSTMWLTTVEVQFQWFDGDSGETLPVFVFVGTGADTGDKGIYKALTGAEKYALMKTFLVSTGDDPEADEKVDKASAAAGAATGTRVVRGNVAGAQRGGKSETVTDAQVKEMSRLTKEAGLDATTIIPVIKKVLGKAPAGPTEVRAFLLGLSSEDGGKLIAVLASGFAADIETEGAPMAADDTAELDEEAADEMDHARNPDGQDGAADGFSLV